ncbi:hypothetical protein FHU10_4324 [Serratia fonticola]|jgi:hypothetical protein|uniref:Uncharacterized protein n=1 Tax=Serratia fonticola TaxID=47917 RepID=A0A542BQL3_SERFO|nr:hypothetical protein FHU09_3380 [Serratia fonticola]TQI97188.1 hypothetical protein FHU11_2665 [Serratia fonticola]TVZ71684.1 hypothetical protein FHU10_4324 [Serratia fonticola]
MGILWPLLTLNNLEAIMIENHLKVAVRVIFYER